MLISEVKPKEVLNEMRDKYGKTASFKYCETVFFGKAKANKKTILGCKRFLRDLKLSEEGKSEFYFNIAEADSLEGMSKMLVDPKTRKPFTPALFQVYIIQQLAWFKTSNNARRYRRMYLSLGRKQGKSLIVAFMAVYEFLFGTAPEYEREIVITSRSERQAKKIFNQLRTIFLELMKKKELGLKDRLKIGYEEIRDEESGSTIRYYASNPDSIDSTDPVMGIIDEYAEAEKGREMYERIKSGMTFQKNGLMIAVSTVSKNLNSPMYEDYKFAERVLNDEVDSEREFIFIAELDTDEEWRDKENWSKSSPLLLEEGFKEEAMESILEDVRKAEDSGDTSTLMAKTFNRWVKNNVDRYLNYYVWEESAVEGYDIRGKRVHIGIDLSERNDLTSVGIVVESGRELYVDGHSFVANLGYLDGKTVKERNNNAELYIKGKSTRDEFDYIKSIEEGHITESKGTIDYKEIIEYILDYVEDNELELEGVYYDPWGMTKFTSDMESMGVDLPLVEVGQTVSVLSEPIKEFRVNLLDGRIKHSNNSVINYSVRNAIIKELNGEYKLDKPTSNLKIDAIESVINPYTELVGYLFEEEQGEQGVSKLEEFLRAGNFFG